MTTSTVVPGFIGSTPSEVPQRITSPGSRVMSCEMRETSSVGAEKHVGQGVVLPFAPTHQGAQLRASGFEGRVDERAQGAESVEALGAVHCAKVASRFSNSSAVTSLAQQ